MTNRIRIEIGPDDPGWNQVLQETLLPLARAAALDELAGMGLLLAIVEAINNIIEHAYQGSDGQPIALVWEQTASTIRLDLHDHGRPMPLPLPSGDLPDDPLALGGRGWHIIRANTDEVQYRRVQEENVLTLVKNLT